jgi:hypothetical protein
MDDYFSFFDFFFDGDAVLGTAMREGGIRFG